MKNVLRTMAVILGGAFLGGCAASSDPAAAPGGLSAEAKAARAKYVLGTEPEGAQGVIDLRKSAENDDEVVMVGRIGGDRDPWIAGQAAFLITDTSLVACNEIEGDKCVTPWDFCCEGRLKEGKATVLLVDEQGQTLPIDARDVLGVPELATVVVRGKAQRDEAGNLTVLATGVFVR